MSARSPRQAQVLRISHSLGSRELVWFGTRGDDADAVTDLPQLTHAFSVIGRYRLRSTVTGLALEDIDGQRVDLDSYDIDHHLAEDHVRELRRHLLRALSGPSAVFTYRPSAFLSAICFARVGRTRYLGLFKDFQSAFEHKPWVESAVADLGIPRVSWEYVADEDQLEAVRLFDQGPVVLRPSRTSGGVGIIRVDSDRDLAASWLRETESFVSIAPFIEDAVPVNVGAVVWDDGVTVHHPSFQLIGIPEFTSRPFGYCGNDFGAMKDLPRATVDAIERSTRAVGTWLGGRGFRGAFGIDFLVKDDVPLFLEVNPRFQGSTHASCRISRQEDQPCVMLDHLAAMLGLECPERPPLTDLVRGVPDLSHVVVHHQDASAAGIDAVDLVEPILALPSYRHADVLADMGHTVSPGATVARLTLAQRVTSTGFDLRLRAPLSAVHPTARKA